MQCHSQVTAAKQAGYLRGFLQTRPGEKRSRLIISDQIDVTTGTNPVIILQICLKMYVIPRNTINRAARANVVTFYVSRFLDISHNTDFFFNFVL